MESLPPQGEYKFDDAIDFDQRYSIVSPRARQGDPLAAQTLGLLLFQGVGGADADAEASAEWHAAAAARGNLDGLATLGGCVRRGVGVARDETVGRTIIEAAAAVGSPVALCKLGVMHDEGECGLQRDAWQAARCFEAAAAQGSALGQFNWGWALVHGIGTPRDVSSGIAQWVAAMDQAPNDGSEEAAYQLFEERRLIEGSDLDGAVNPILCLRLSASLGLDLAVERIERAEERRRTRKMLEAYSKPADRQRYRRNDKARGWTAKEERGEAFLDGLSF